MTNTIIDISFEYPDAYTKRKRFYTGKAIMQDAYKNMYLVFDFLDENKRPPLNFSSVIYLSPVKLESNVFWVSLDKQHQKELLHAIGEAIENAVI